MPPRKQFLNRPRTDDEAQAQEEDFQSLFSPRLDASRASFQDVPVNRIEPNPFQARRTFDETSLDELAGVIRMQGFTSRLRVRPHPERPEYFQLVYGERRLRAARLAGLTTVPCEIAAHSDADMIEIGLAENIHRRDLDPLEEARAFQVFIDQRGYSIRSLAERIGKNRGYTVSSHARLWRVRCGGAVLSGVR